VSIITVRLLEAVIHYSYLHKECNRLAQKEGESDCTMQPRNFWRELGISLIEPMTSATSSYRSSGQLLASARFARDQTPSSELSSGA
jgi:hypothetical protein